MLNTVITDIQTKTRAKVTADNALKVATAPYNNYIPAARFFQNDVYGIDLNKNFSNEAGGNANEDIHNGTDTAEWTGSAPVGTWDFASTNNPDTGSKNIEQLLAGVAYTAQFARGSDVTMSAHTGFTGRIYITTTGHLLAELHFYAWDTGTGTIVGNTVNIYDYVNPLVLGVYQTFNIPLVDMGLTGATFDAVRFTIAVKAGAIFDIDNIVLNDPTGGAAIGTTVFELTPALDTTLYIDGFIINVADAYDGKVADGTLTNLPYDGFLGETVLASPLIYRVHDGDNITFIATFSQLMDFMQFGKPEILASGSDGVNTWFTLYIGLTAPIELFDNIKQKITLTISSDLSGLLFFRFSANCRSLTENS